MGRLNGPGHHAYERLRVPEIRSEPSVAAPRDRAFTIRRGDQQSIAYDPDLEAACKDTLAAMEESRRQLIEERKAEIERKELQLEEERRALAELAGPEQRSPLIRSIANYSDREREASRLWKEGISARRIAEKMQLPQTTITGMIGNSRSKGEDLFPARYTIQK